MNIQSLFLPIITCTLLMVGCGSSAKKEKDYGVRIENQSGVELDDVEAWFGKKVCGVGILPHEIGKTHLFFNVRPIPQEVVVKFTDKKGEGHTRKVKLKLPETFDLIGFTIEKGFKVKVIYRIQK